MFEQKLLSVSSYTFHVLKDKTKNKTCHCSIVKSHSCRQFPQLYPSSSGISLVETLVALLFIFVRALPMAQCMTQSKNKVHCTLKRENSGGGGIWFMVAAGAVKTSVSRHISRQKYYTSGMVAVG